MKKITIYILITVGICFLIPIFFTVKFKIEEMLEEKGAKKVVLSDLTKEDMHEAVEDAFKYDKIVLASSSYNAGVFVPMHQFLNQLKERNYQNRKIGIIENGSWAPSAAKTMKSILEEMKDITIVEPVVTIKSTMKQDTVSQMEKLVESMIGGE